MRTPSFQKKYVLSVLKKFPETPSQTLAKLAFKECPELFTTLDAARTAFRIVRGANGAGKKKENAAHREFAEIWDKAKMKWTSPTNPFNIPPSDTEEWTAFVIPDVVKKLLIISDIHFPYHDVDALILALEKGRDEECDGILLNGDIMDFYQASNFIRDPRKRSVAGEIEMTRNFLTMLTEQFPNCQIYYKLGNHEERYENYLSVKAPELLGVQDFLLERLLKLDELGIEIIRDQRTINFGKLNILHGHEFRSGISAPVNISRGVFLKAKESTLVGHSHVTSEHTEPTLNGKLITCWSTGCLSELRPRYARHGKFNFGFAIVTRTNGEQFSVNNYRIYENRIL